METNVNVYQAQVRISMYQESTNSLSAGWQERTRLGIRRKEDNITTIAFYPITNTENRNINPTRTHRRGQALTAAAPWCAECAANLATWFIMGEKLVGP